MGLGITCKSEMTEKLPFAAEIGKCLYYIIYFPLYACDLSRTVCLSIPHIQAEIDVELSNLIQGKTVFP